MQMPKFTKIATDGRPSYRFELGGKTYEAYRNASGAGAWNVDAIEDDKRRTVITGEDSRAAAVTNAANAEREARLDQLADDVVQMHTDADELLDDMRQLGSEADELQTEVAAWGAKVDELTEREEPETRRADELGHGDVVRIAGMVYTVHHTEPAAHGKLRVCVGLDGTVSYALRPNEAVRLTELPVPPAGEHVEYFVEVDRHVQARPRVYEDRYSIRQRGLADPIEGFALPYRGDRSDGTTLEMRGWRIVGELEYVPVLNVMRGRVEKAPTRYGNAGNWVSACVVDPDAGPIPGYAAVGRCGTPLMETTDTPRGHALCVACTGDAVEMHVLRDRTGWLADGGRPVRVLQALDYGRRVVMRTVTTDAEPREWNDVTTGSILFAEEHPAKRDEIAAGALVEGVVAGSTHPRRMQVRVDRQPWGDDRSTILSDGRGVDAVYTDSLRVIEQPEPVHIIDRVDASVRAAAGQCRHGFTLRPGATLSIPCELGNRYGVFSDEGLIDGSDCAVQAANDAAFYTAEDDGDSTHEVAIICPDHEEQRADSCEDCLAEPADD